MRGEREIDMVEHPRGPAPNNEVEITEAMIDAGVDALDVSDWPRDPAVSQVNVVYAILYRELEAGGFSPTRS